MEYACTEFLHRLVLMVDDVYAVWHYDEDNPYIPSQLVQLGLRHKTCSLERS